MEVAGVIIGFHNRLNVAVGIDLCEQRRSHGLPLPFPAAHSRLGHICAARKTRRSSPRDQKHPTVWAAMQANPEASRSGASTTLRTAAVDPPRSSLPAAILQMTDSPLRHACARAVASAIADLPKLSALPDRCQTNARRSSWIGEPKLFRREGGDHSFLFWSAQQICVSAPFQFYCETLFILVD